MIWWRKRKRTGSAMWNAMKKYEVANALLNYSKDWSDGIDELDCMAEQIIAEGEDWT